MVKYYLLSTSKLFKKESDGKTDALSGLFHFMETIVEWAALMVSKAEVKILAGRFLYPASALSVAWTDQETLPFSSHHKVGLIMLAVLALIESLF